MAEISDDRVPWAELRGGFGDRYDPRPALAAVEGGAGGWDELWEQLFHQGDVGEASYAAVPIIARMVENAEPRDWNPFCLAASIEAARINGRNPALPPWLAQDYASAWESLFRTAHRLIVPVTDELLTRCLLAIISMHKDHRVLGAIALLGEDEQQEMLDAGGGI